LRQAKRAVNQTLDVQASTPRSSRLRHPPDVTARAVRSVPILIKLDEMKKEIAGKNARSHT